MNGIKYISLTIVLVASMGCAKEKNSKGSTPATTTASNSINGGPGATLWSYGETAALKNVSATTFSSYLMKTVSSPSNIRVNLDLTDLGSGKYGGAIKISYTSAGRYSESEFIGGDDDAENMYNRWVTIGSEDVFHGFYQDEYGAVVVVVNADAGFGDGSVPNAKAKGSIWFKNFKYYGPATAPQGPSMCWFISIGPYDCRSFLVNNQIVSTSSVNPNNGYRKLGDFVDISLSDAFNY